MMNSDISVWWNELITKYPETSILQTYQWGEVKAEFDWQPSLHVWYRDEIELQHKVLPFQAGDRIFDLDPAQIEGASLVLMREIPIAGFAFRPRIFYTPKGPLLLDWANRDLRKRVLSDLIGFAKRKGGIFLKIDPEVVIGYGEPDTSGDEVHPGSGLIHELQNAGWVYSPSQIQFKNTMLMDLSAPEEDLLMDMKQKTRYNIRLAGRKGVTVRVGSQKDHDLLYEMYQETAGRDGFVIRGRDYYHRVWQTFAPRKDNGATTTPECIPLIAEVEGQPIAALVLFVFGKKAWYLYGMSTSLHRNRMPNYLLQWEAIKQAKAAGCETYDLWGAPEVFDESDSLWGVYRFKTGLGSEVMRTIGAWDYPTRPLLYRLYTNILPRILSFMRSRRMREIESSAESFV